MREPLISVIVPAFNAERTLAETLLSVKHQTYENLEIIIVDDGSTDSTADIAEEFCATERRAQLFRKDNGGVASARNLGISKAKGEWIAPLDADDLWHPTRIHKMFAAALAATERPGFVYSWCRHVDAEGRIVQSGPRWPVEGMAFERAAHFNIVGNGSGLLADPAVLREVGYYDESLRAEKAQGAEDLLLQVRIAARYPIVLVPEHLVAWRNAGSSMSTDVEQMDRSCRLVYRRLAETGTPVAPYIERRMLASSALEVAEHYAFSRNFRRALEWLGRALWYDPVRSILFVTYRVARSARRIFGKSSDVQNRPRFDRFDPSACFEGDPYRLEWFERLLRDFDLRRLERLSPAQRWLGDTQLALKPACGAVGDVKTGQSENI